MQRDLVAACAAWRYTQRRGLEPVDDRRRRGQAEPIMQRVTITIDEELMSALDQYMEAGGHRNRSEAVRDLVRAGLLKRP